MVCIAIMASLTSITVTAGRQNAWSSETSGWHIHFKRAQIWIWSDRSATSSARRALRSSVGGGELRRLPKSCRNCRAAHLGRETCQEPFPGRKPSTGQKVNVTVHDTFSALKRAGLLPVGCHGLARGSRGKHWQASDSPIRIAPLLTILPHSTAAPFGQSAAAVRLTWQAAPAAMPIY
jgi:hypothetical protein